MGILLLEDLATDARQWLEARHPVDYRPELLDDAAQLRSQIYKTRALIAPPRLKISASGRVISRSGVGTPTSTTRPARSRA